MGIQKSKIVHFYSWFITHIFLYLLKSLVVTKTILPAFPGGAVVKNPPANAGDTGSSPAQGRSHVPRSN